MNKKSITSVILLCLSLLALPAMAQRVNLDPQHARGSLLVTPADGSPVEVWYAFAPAYPDNLLLQFMPKSEFTLRAHIVDKAGAEVLALPEETVGLRYANSLEVAKLLPGTYYVEIYNGPDPQKVHRVPFAIGAK